MCENGHFVHTRQAEDVKRVVEACLACTHQLNSLNWGQKQPIWKGGNICKFNYFERKNNTRKSLEVYRKIDRYHGEQ